jgi:S1-C subfamily serine protease
MAGLNSDWSEADLGDPALRQQLGEHFVLIAEIQDGHLAPLGTGFVVSLSEDQAVVLTASHTLEDIRVKQNPPRDIAFRSFTPGLVVQPRQEIDIDRMKVRVLCRHGNAMQAAVIERAQYAERTDIAVLHIRSQDTTSPFAPKAIPLSAVVPAIGDEIVVLGFAFMEVTDTVSHGDFRSQKTGVQLVMRRGYVTEISRLIMGEGLAAHASIPVFGGMSGGPVVLMNADGSPGPVFGIVASSPDADTATACNMTAALLQVAKIEFPDGSISSAIAFEREVDAVNQEFKLVLRGAPQRSKAVDDKGR